MAERRRIAIVKGNPASVSRVLRRRNPTVTETEGEIVRISLPEAGLVPPLLRKPIHSNFGAFRSGAYLHVSDLIGKCARRIALSEKFNSPMPTQFLQESMLLTFAQGVAIHDHVKKSVIEASGGNVFGTWSCRCGQLHTDNSLFSRIKSRKCSRCGGGPHNYHELELRDEDLMIVGSPDITLLLVEHSAYLPVEIKSINPDEWKDIARPKPDHVIQVLFYWYLMRKLGYPVVDAVSILYATKGFVFASPYKEFVLRPEKVLHRLNEYIDEARYLKEARNNGALPPRSFCPNDSCANSKSCHVSKLCFSL